MRAAATSPTESPRKPRFKAISAAAAPLSFTSNPPVSLTDEGESERPNKITYRLICPPCSSHPASFYSSCREQPLSSSLSFPICASGQEINKSCMQPRLNDLFHVLLVCSDTGCAGSVGKKNHLSILFSVTIKTVCTSRISSFHWVHFCWSFSEQ